MNEIARGRWQSEPGDVRRAPRVGAIVIARHGRPDVDRNVKLTWRDYIEWWAAYDRSGLAPGQVAPAGLVEAAGASAVIYSSTLPRAIDTARAAAGEREIIQDSVFIEAPLPPPPLAGRRRPGHWGVVARASWWLGRAGGMETRREAELRAEAAVATLTAQALRGENVLLCAHGWFNRMMRPVLRAQGWRCAHDGGDHYWSYRRYEKAR